MIYRNSSFRVFVLATALMSFLSTNGMEDKKQQSFTPLPPPPSNHQPLPLPPINPDVSRHFGISQEQWSSMSSEEQRSIMVVYQNDMREKRKQEQQEKEDAAIARAMAGEDRSSSSVILPPPPPRSLPLSPTSSLTSSRPSILDKQQAKLQRISEYMDQMSEYMKPSTTTSSSSSSASFDDRGIIDIMPVDQTIWDNMSIDEKFQAVSMFRDQLYAEIATDQFNEEDERIRRDQLRQDTAFTETLSEKEKEQAGEDDRTLRMLSHFSVEHTGGYPPFFQTEAEQKTIAAAFEAEQREAMALARVNADADMLVKSKAVKIIGAGEPGTIGRIGAFYSLMGQEGHFVHSQNCGYKDPFVIPSTVLVHAYNYPRPSCIFTGRSDSAAAIQDIGKMLGVSDLSGITEIALTIQDGQEAMIDANRPTKDGKVYPLLMFRPGWEYAREWSQNPGAYSANVGYHAKLAVISYKGDIKMLDFNGVSTMHTDADGGYLTASPPNSGVLEGMDASRVNGTRAIVYYVDYTSGQFAGQKRAGVVILTGEGDEKTSLNNILQSSAYNNHVTMRNIVDVIETDRLLKQILRKF